MEIVQVIIFIVMILLALVLELKKQAKKSQVANNIEPDISSLSAEPEEETTLAGNKKPLRETCIQTIEEKKTIEKVSKTKAIHIKTKNEARKAFIYSEIFQRKY